MIHRYLLLSLFIAAFITMIIKSDDDYVVEYHICHYYTDAIASVLEDFIDKTTVHLQTQQANIIFETDSLYTCSFKNEDAIADLKFYETTNSESIITNRQIIVELSSQEINNISPLLSNDLTVSISLYQEDAEKLLASLLLYSIGDIGQAEENLLGFQDNSDYKDIQTEINFYLSNIAIIKGDVDLGIERFPESYWISIENFFGANLAWMKLQQGESKEAIDIMTDAIDRYQDMQVPSGEIEARVDRAKLYALSFDYTSGINDMNSAIQIAEENEYPNSDLAILYKERSDIIMLIYEWNRAYNDYTKAIELDPDYAEAYYRRGILLYTMFERESAIDDFETYLDLDPDRQYAESASTYIEDITTEIDSLDGS